MVAVEPPPSVLVMTRPDGSTYEFPDLEVTCEGTRVLVMSPRVMDGKRIRQPFVYIEITASLEERRFRLPLPDDQNTQEPPFVVFVADTEGAPDGNEVSSSSSSTGTLTVTRASCDPPRSSSSRST